MATAFPSLDMQVRYNIKVDMVRQGLHRHECTSTTFFYLPRSIPTSLQSLSTAFEEVEAKSEAADDVEWKMGEAYRVTKPEGAAEGTIVQFGLPLPLSYTAGIPIPFRATIVTTAPLDCALIRSKLSVQLLRISAVTVAKQRVRLDRSIGTCQIWSVQPAGPDSGIWEITGSVNCGSKGSEVSWCMANYMEIRYAVKFFLAPTDCTAGYKREEMVQLVTDEAQDFELEEARERPALGLINPAYPIRSPYP